MAKPHSLCRRAQGSSPAAVPRACRTDPSPSPSYWPSSWGSLGTPWRVRAGARGTGDVPRPHGPQGSGVQELQPPAARKEGRTKQSFLCALLQAAPRVPRAPEVAACRPGCLDNGRWLGHCNAAVTNEPSWRFPTPPPFLGALGTLVTMSVCQHL